MSYITNANARMDILSITAGYSEYRLTTHRMLSNAARPRSRLGRGGNPPVDYQKKYKNVATRCQI